MNSVPEILEQLAAGKMIVLIDDEQRENEGDLVCAAEFVTPAIINFMLREARGMLCVPLAGEICDRLQLVPQSAVNTTHLGTAYTVSVDAHARFDVTTGVSAADRATTIKVLGDRQSKPSDLVRPGHVNPLRARDGGVLVRAGQTEGSVDLCRLAGLRPAAAIIEIMNEDGSMARLGDLQKFCQRQELKLCSVADIIQYRLEREKLIERVGETRLETRCGPFRAITYRSVVDPMPHVALLCGDVGQRDDAGEPKAVQDPVLVRMHSQNLLGDVFGDTEHATGRTLESAMRMIQAEGRGAVVYLRHERIGIDGLEHPSPAAEAGSTKCSIDGTGLQVGPKGPRGEYGIGSQILRDLGIRKLRLLTNHPFRPAAISGFGLEISQFVPVPV